MEVDIESKELDEGDLLIEEGTDAATSVIAFSEDSTEMLGVISGLKEDETKNPENLGDTLVDRDAVVVCVGDRLGDVAETEEAISLLIVDGDGVKVTKVDVPGGVETDGVDNGDLEERKKE